MRKNANLYSLLLLIPLLILLILPSPVKSEIPLKTSLNLASLSSLSSIWLYGAPNSWGSIGFDDKGGEISTAQSSANTFYHWADTLETMTNKTLSLQADLILYSNRGYNALVEETAIAILEEAAKRGRDNVRIAIDISVPADWDVSDVEKLVKIIFKGKSGYLSMNFLDMYGDKVDLSIDFEPPVFYNGLYITSKQVNHLHKGYSEIRNSESPSRSKNPTDYMMYIYNFGNMIAAPEKLHNNIITIYNGISNKQDILADSYRNVLNVIERPIGLMVFVLPHLGEKQRMGAFDKGNLEEVLTWLVDQKINVPLLGFQ